MAVNIWEVTKEDTRIASFGLSLQYDHLSRESFINNQIEVVASLHAQVRFLQNIIHQNQNKES